jgi:hypothetical protein
MTKNRRRWSVLIAVAGISAILVCFQGWRLLKRSQWLQQLVQQQLAARFGESLTYEHLEASFSGVHLSNVSYLPPGRSFALSVEEVSVKFRFWDLLMSAISGGQSGRTVTMGFLSGDSQAVYSLADYRLDLFIANPSLTLIGNWNSRIQNWIQTQSVLSSPPTAIEPRTHSTSLFKTSSASSDTLREHTNDAPPARARSSPSRTWNLEFIKKLHVRNGRILLKPNDNNGPVLLANEMEGTLEPVRASNRKPATSRQSQAILRGKLLDDDQDNLFIQALIDVERGQIDSLSIGLREFALKKIETLWEIDNGHYSKEPTLAGLTGTNELADRSRAEQQSAHKNWKIAGGVVDGQILLQAPRRNRQDVETMPHASAEHDINADSASLNQEAGKQQFDHGAGGISFVPLGARLTGTLRLRDGQVQFAGRLPVVVEAITSEVELRDRMVYIRNGSQLVNRQSVRLAGTVNLVRLSQPEFDLLVESDSLMISELLSPFFPEKQKPESQPQTRTESSALPIPIHGKAAFRCRLTGSLPSPGFDAEIHSPHLKIYGQSVQNISLHFLYTPWRSDGNADSTVHLVKGFGEFDGLRWKGSGELNVLHSQQPLQMRFFADGELTPSLKKLLPFAPPSCDAAVDAQIFGPLKDPHATGHFTFHVLHNQGLAVSSSARRNSFPSGIAGSFTFYQDTLRIESHASLEPEGSSPSRLASARRNKSRSDSADPPGIELSGEVWHLSRLSTDKSAGSAGMARHPLFKIHGREIQFLPAFLGKDLAPMILSRLKLDTYIQGHTDSMNIRIDGRHQDGYTLFQLFGYMWPMGQDQRHISGNIKLFPGAYNEINASYSAVWQDSVFYITDLRVDDWLIAGLEVQTRGNGSISGNVKITRADMSRILESVAREVPRYSGNLFGEVRLNGTLEAPYAEGEFWVFDAIFNRIGKFAMSGKVRMDARGWEVSRFQARKNDQPFVEGTFGYQRATREPRLELHGQDIEISDFLGALAGVPPEVLIGKTSFELKTNGVLRLPDGGKKLQLAGFINVKKGRVVWFEFDELAIDLNAASATKPPRLIAPAMENRNLMAIPSYLARDGVFLSRIRYEKKNEFVLEGAAYLPFNLQDALDLTLSGDGNFLAVLSDLTSFFRQTAGSGHLDLNVVGPYEDLTLPNSFLRIQNGFLKMSQVVPEVREITCEAFVDSRGTFIDILKLEGKVGDATLKVRNQESPPPFLAVGPGHHSGNGTDDWIRIHQPLRLGGSPLHLGTLLIKSTENGLLANIPGLMENGEVGRFVVTGQGTQDEFLVTGPWAHPLFKGRVILEDVDFMFPFDENAEPADSLVLKILMNINWDVVAQSRKDNRYVKRVPTALDNVYVNFGIDDDSALRFTGILQDSTFRTEGKISSTRGTVEYLDLNFRVEKFGAEFDKSDWLPIVYGRAWTVMTDSTGFPYNVYLTLHTQDPITLEEVPRGRFQNAYFKLTSDNPSMLGIDDRQNTQEHILASFGYSAENVRAKATEAVGISTDNLIFRPLIRPVEKQLKRHLGLDMVRLSSRFTRNFLVTNFNNELTPSLPNETIRGKMALAMLQSTRLLLGKYLWSDLYLHYIGQVELGPDDNPEAKLETQPYIGLGLRHTLGLEYRINPAMLLQFEYDYNPLLATDKDDRKIWLRHSFPVDFGGKQQ